MKTTMADDDRLLIINLGLDVHLQPWPEPLLAPHEEHSWKLKWSSESPCYGAYGTPVFDPEGNWLIPGRCALVFVPQRIPSPPRGKG